MKNPQASPADILIKGKLSLRFQSNVLFGFTMEEFGQKKNNVLQKLL